VLPVRNFPTALRLRSPITISCAPTSAAAWTISWAWLLARPTSRSSCTTPDPASRLRTNSSSWTGVYPGSSTAFRTVLSTSRSVPRRRASAMARRSAARPSADGT
jgi:hypothetical protein